MTQSNPPEPFNEQKVLYEWEQKFCRMIKPMLYALGADRLQEEHRIGRSAELPHEWGIGWKKGGSKRHRTRVYFRGIDYTDGEPEEGTPVIYDLGDAARSWSRKYVPKAIPVSEEIDEGIELHTREWEEYGAEASFSVTNRTTVKAEVKAGDVASASAENETTITAGGSAFGRGGGEKASTRTHRVKTTVHREDLERAKNLGKSVLLTADINKRKVVTPIIENGFIEADIMLDLDDWAEEHKSYLRDSKDEGRNRIYCSTIRDLIWFIEGQRVAEYPRMTTFLADQRKGTWWSAKGTVQFYEWLKDSEARRQRLAKERIRVYESAGEVRTAFVD